MKRIVLRLSVATGVWLLSLPALSETPGDTTGTPLGGPAVTAPVETGSVPLSVPAVKSPAEVKPATVPPAAIKPVAAPPIEVKPTAAPPAEIKPVAAPPVEVKPVAAPPAEIKPVTLPPAESKPVAAKPVPPRKLIPVDDGAADASWVQFRAWLLETLRRGDRRALAGIVDAHVVNALDAPRGVAEFRRMWDLDGKDDRLLRDLSVMLRMGSAWYQPVLPAKGARLLCAPYVPIKWPLDDVDPYASGAIVVKDALVKDAPSHGAHTLGNLSYDIVAVRDWDVADRDAKIPQRWMKILLAQRDGYVPVEHIRSAIEHRACFAKSGAGWRLMEYVLGIEYLGGSD